MKFPVGFIKAERAYLLDHSLDPSAVWRHKRYWPLFFWLVATYSVIDSAPKELVAQKYVSLFIFLYNFFSVEKF